MSAIAYSIINIHLPNSSAVGMLLRNYLNISKSFTTLYMNVKEIMRILRYVIDRL